MASGWVRLAISPTQSRSFACVVGAVAAVGWLIPGTLLTGAEAQKFVVRLVVGQTQVDGFLLAALERDLAAELDALFDVDSRRAVGRDDRFRDDRLEIVG